MVVSFTDDPAIQNGSAFLPLGLQIAAGVPLMCDEGDDYRSFRLGLFGLDKLKDVDGTVARLGAALDFRGLSSVDRALALELALWGADAADLAFLTPPPEGAMAEAFSAERAARYLDSAALHWQQSRRCVTCHTDDLANATNPPHLTLGYTENCDRCHMPTTWNQATVR